LTAAAFPPSLTPAQLAVGVVQVWVTDLDRWIESSMGMPVSLAPDEVSRAERFHNPLHGKRWRTGRQFLRAVLGSHLGSDPSELELGVAEMGKPFLPESVLSFNLSHSGERVVVAVTSRRDVGIDVEAMVDRGLELDPLAERFFTPGERAELGVREGSERAAAFYRCWTRKEAVMKADGGGLVVPPEAINVGAGTKPDVVVADPPWKHLERYRVLDLEIERQYACALAVADVVEVKVTAV